MHLFNRFVKAVQAIRGVRNAVVKKNQENKRKPEQGGKQQNNDDLAKNSDALSVFNDKIISTNLYKNETMTMFNYGVGGNEIKVDANDAIQEIQGNKSLLVAKLTTNDAVSPEIVTGLKTVEDVFRHYTPTMDVEHTTLDGEFVNEEFRFKNLGDFTPNKMVENSSFLKGLKLDEEQYNKIVKQLRVNKVLRKLLEDEIAKKEFATILRAIERELEK
ncbi:hypothetical protein [Myroides fluvii]|uniref:hypothetical protein n=1 Tax=Myroides fluvii TaxID=2572594 RepID=UPI00131D9D29|nr:hypothetical protein [Myroides fluvii]